MIGIYIAILCLGMIMAIWGAYCVIKQNKFHFYGAIACVYGAAMIGVSLALMMCYL